VSSEWKKEAKKKKKQHRSEGTKPIRPGELWTTTRCLRANRPELKGKEEIAWKRTYILNGTSGVAGTPIAQHRGAGKPNTVTGNLSNWKTERRTGPGSKLDGKSKEYGGDL